MPTASERPKGARWTGCRFIHRQVSAALTEPRRAGRGGQSGGKGEGGTSVGEAERRRSGRLPRGRQRPAGADGVDHAGEARGKQVPT